MVNLPNDEIVSNEADYNAAGEIRRPAARPHAAGANALVKNVKSSAGRVSARAAYATLQA
jgi:hypothetical protein